MHTNPELSPAQWISPLFVALVWISTFSLLRERFKQIKMIEPRYFVSTDGGNVFVESRGDYIAQDGTAYQNVYIFKFVVQDRKIAEEYEYANPVTYAK